MDQVSCSVIIPTYDRPGLLVRAVTSALKALPKDGEVVVVDDRSTEPVGAFISELNDLRVRVLSNPGPKGPSGARNAGLAVANGSRLYFLDDDDVLETDYIDRTLAAEADYGFSAYRLIDLGGRTRILGQNLPDGAIASDAPVRFRVAGFGMGFWIRADKMRQAGEIDTELRVHEDAEFFCRLLRLGFKGWFSRAPGVAVHQHRTGSDTQNLTSSTARAERAAALETVAFRYPEFMHYLGPSHIKYLARNNMIEQAASFIEKVDDPMMRVRLKALLTYKRAGHRIKRSFG